MWIRSVVLLTSIVSFGAFTVTAQEPGAPSKKVEPTPRPPRDPADDPLPQGAVARIGSLRYRHEDYVARMVISGDGKAMITVSPGRPSGVQKWNLADGRGQHLFRGPGPTDIALLSDGKTLVVGHWLPGDGAVFIDLETGKQVRRIETP